MSRYLRYFALPLCLAGAFTTTLSANSIDAIYSFGDSLSDAGNIYALTNGTIPSSPYSQGRFTNGNVWVQDLSVALGLNPVSASLTGGTDFAYGDASTGSTPVHAGTFIDLTGAAGQLTQFHAANPVADPNALYTIWIGSNDVSDILKSGTPATDATDVAASIANIDSAIATLAGYGAKNFLVLTVPDLGKTPTAIGGGRAAQTAASSLAAAFDLTLVNGNATAGLPSLGNLAGAAGINLSVLDTYSLIDSVVANPNAFGFTDVTDACVTGSVNYIGGTACANPSQYLFWDELHPTAGGHALVGDAALATITPEPASMALLGMGLLGVFLSRRKKSL
jgi:phospholipase/lecithinase/hemolysin